MSLIDPNLFKAEPEVSDGRPFAPAGPAGPGPEVANFRDSRGMTLVVCILLVLAMLANGAFALATSWNPDDVELLGAVGFGVMCITLPQFIMLMVWFYRANKNARSIATGLETTPGWAVGYFFIPVLSWFRPYQTMSEIWRSAHSPLSWKTLDDPVILRVWWGAWLAGAIGGLAANLLFGGGGVALWIATAFSIVADGITLVLIRQVAARQWENKDQSVFD